MDQRIAFSALMTCVACMDRLEPAEVESVAEPLGTARPAIIVAADPNGNAIPCATISTLDGDYSYVTDSSGIAAIYEPEFMGKSVALVITHPADPGIYADKDNFFANIHHVVLKGAETLADLTVLTSRASVPAGTTCPTPVPPYTTFLDANSNVPMGAALAKFAVVDSQTNLPLPAVMVASPRRTYVTDNNGVVAVFENGFMNTQVKFNVSSDGYVAKSNLALTLTPGLAQTIKLDPEATQVAQRLYRVTGPNRTRESVLLGDVALPPLNADVLSQDGPMTAVHNGKVYWTFGDTTTTGGLNGRGTSATSDVAADPTKPITLSYLHQPTLAIAPPEAFPPFDPSVSFVPAAWPGGLVSVSDAQGPHLYSNFLLIDKDYHHYGFYQGVYDGDAAGTYSKQTALDESKPSQPGAHTYTFKAATGSFVFAENLTRYPATVTGATTPGSYQTYTAFNQQSKIARDTTTQRILYSWQTQLPEITDAVGRFIQLPPEEIIDGKLRDVPASSTDPHLVPVKSHARTYDAYRQRFVDVITENTIPEDANWYAEGDTPMGPWVYASRITGTGVNSQYNQVITPYTTNNGAQIFFALVFGNAGLGPVLTHYYNYNVMMYRLDLTDQRTALPVPVYELTASTAASVTLGPKGQVRSTMPAELPIPFFAYDRPTGATVPAYFTGAACRGARTLKVGTQPAFPVLYAPDFWVLPANITSKPADSVALFEFTKGTSRRYAIEGMDPPSGFTRSTSPIARVFKNPMSKVWFPVKDYLGDLVADGGADICVPETTRGGGRNIALDASHTLNSTGKTVSYTWTWTTSSSVSGAATGKTPTIHLPAGTHTIQLIVETSDGRSSFDKVVVDIAAI